MVSLGLLSMEFLIITMIGSVESVPDRQRARTAHVYTVTMLNEFRALTGHIKWFLIPVRGQTVLLLYANVSRSYI